MEEEPGHWAEHVVLGLHVLILSETALGEEYSTNTTQKGECCPM